MIGLSSSSISKQNIWSHYDWVVVVVYNNDNPIIMRPYIVFIDGRQRQPNHSKHNMWSYYDWVVIVVRQ
jgi:hypothetical protein